MPINLFVRWMNTFSGEANLCKLILFLFRSGLMCRKTQKVTTAPSLKPRQSLPKMLREKSRVCHNHKPQPFPDPKRKRKLTHLNKHKPNKRTKSTKISSLFPKRGNRNTERTEKHKNKMTHVKTYNKSPRRINHKATQSKTNTGTTALVYLVSLNWNILLRLIYRNIETK